MLVSELLTLFKIQFTCNQRFMEVMEMSGTYQHYHQLRIKLGHVRWKNLGQDTMTDLDSFGERDSFSFKIGK